MPLAVHQLDDTLAAMSLFAPGGVISIGNFDGIHLGHAGLLKQMRELCEGPKIIVSFEPHPATVLRPDRVPPRLTPMSLKCELLQAVGVTDLCLLTPTPQLLSQSPHDFFQAIAAANPVAIVEGKDFYFGKNRAGDITLLRQLCRDAGIAFTQAIEVECTMSDGRSEEVSSSLVRRLITAANLPDAALALGRPYALHGPVVKGFQRGRTLGYPTANIQTQQLLPPDGVYAARTTIDGKRFRVALSIGTLPTFNETVRQVEAFVLDFTGDLYDRVMSIDVLSHLRGQEKFHSIESLRTQMAIDVQRVRAM